MSQELNNLDGLKGIGKLLGRKIACCAAGWVVLYFLSQPFRVDGSALMLFSPLVGFVAGGVIGWWMAEDAVETAGFSGLALWVGLVAAAVIVIWPTEGIMRLAMGKGWPMGFGGFMIAMSATVTALGTSVWRASADD